MADTTQQAPVVVNQTNFDTQELGPALNTLVTESKKGYKTTEFWVTVAVALLTLLNGIPLPEKYEGAVIAGLAGVYALSRGFAKQGVPVVEPSKDEQTPVTTA
jgi:hypothetical protein